MYQTIGDILRSIVSNSHFGRRPGARDVNIFGSHVGPHIPNSGYWEAYTGMWRYVEVYERIWKYMKVYESIWGYMGVYEGTCDFLSRWCHPRVLHIQAAMH